MASPPHIQTGSGSGGNGARGGIDPSDVSPKYSRPSFKTPVRRTRSIILTDQPRQASLQDHSSQSNLQHSNRVTVVETLHLGAGAEHPGELAIGGGRTGSTVNMTIQRCGEGGGAICESLLAVLCYLLDLGGLEHLALCPQCFFSVRTSGNKHILCGHTPSLTLPLILHLLTGRAASASPSLLHYLCLGTQRRRCWFLNLRSSARIWAISPAASMCTSNGWLGLKR